MIQTSLNRSIYPATLYKERKRKMMGRDGSGGEGGGGLQICTLLCLVFYFDKVS